MADDAKRRLGGAHGEEAEDQKPGLHARQIARDRVAVTRNRPGCAAMGIMLPRSRPADTRMPSGIIEAPPKPWYGIIHELP